MENRDVGAMPRELEGFSWAAFLWGWIWAVFHGVWIGLLGLVPGFGLIMNVILGLKGREWAWRSGAVRSVEQFNKSQRAWVVVWLAFTAFSVVLVLPALAIFGVRQYIVNAKQAEARSTLQVMARGMATCASAGDLPETSAWIPASASSVRGMKYQSVPSEWQREAAFACFKFALTDPQYYRYRWVQATGSSGQFEAEADLNGDGVPDHRFQLGLHCVNGTCEIEQLLGDVPAVAR